MKRIVREESFFEIGFEGSGKASGGREIHHMAGIRHGYKQREKRKGGSDRSVDSVD